MRKNSSIIAERVSGERNPQEYGIIAQLGEHLPYKQRVIGSSPIGPILIKIFLYGGIAQLARAHGSYPWCRWFKSSSRYFKKTCNCKSFFDSYPRHLPFIYLFILICFFRIMSFDSFSYVWISRCHLLKILLLLST